MVSEQEGVHLYRKCTFMKSAQPICTEFAVLKKVLQDQSIATNSTIDIRLSNYVIFQQNAVKSSLLVFMIYCLCQILYFEEQNTNIFFRNMWELFFLQTRP